jgi:hypothetical protein
MSEIHSDEAWQLYRQALRERDIARAELDTLRLLVVDVLHERDEARALARECHDLLGRLLRMEGRVHRDRWEEFERLHDRLRPPDWLPDTPALQGDLNTEPRCPRCGVRLPLGQSCLICDPRSNGPAFE